MRIIPSPEGGDPLIQLIELISSNTNNFVAGDDYWPNQIRGVGSVSFPAQSGFDPWHKLPVIRMIDAFYSGGTSWSDLPYGKVLKTY
ncbi:MAG: acetoacetate decarboxylase family protein [Actinobacteria bacterium]|nr:acetoacetate decarboxylase family protein [Actinomycetota bacterium]